MINKQTKNKIMAKDLYFRCVNDAITRLHHIDFVSGPYLEKLYADDAHEEFREHAKDIREKVNELHDILMEYLKVYKKHELISGYNPLCKPPRKSYKNKEQSIF